MVFYSHYFGQTNLIFSKLIFLDVIVNYRDLAVIVGSTQWAVSTSVGGTELSLHHLLQTGSGTHPAHNPLGCSLPQEYGGRKLATHHNPVPKIGMRVAMPPFSQHVFMVHCLIEHRAYVVISRSALIGSYLPFWDS